MSNIKELAGFGGLIHSFKNYIITGDIQYYKNFEMQHSSLKRNINKYRRIKRKFERGKKRIKKKLKILLINYLGYMADIKKAHTNNKSIEEINMIVQIDDSQAINAIKNLTKNIYGVEYKDWLEKSSLRLQMFKDTEKVISKKDY